MPPRIWDEIWRLHSRIAALEDQLLPNRPFPTIALKPSPRQELAGYRAAPILPTNSRIRGARDPPDYDPNILPNYPLVSHPVPLPKSDVPDHPKISVIFTSRIRLSACRYSLYAIWKNSYFKDHEIVFVGDRITDPPEDRYKVGDYANLEQYLNEFWIPKFEDSGFTFSLFKGDWNRDDLDDVDHKRIPCYECWSYGVDKAKNNFILVVGDDDFMGPNWDYHILKRVPHFDPSKHIFQPVFCNPHIPRNQPSPGMSIQEWGDVHGFDDDRPWAPGWKAFYRDRGKWYAEPMKESELLAHYNHHARNGVFVEQTARRFKLGYWCSVVHKEVIDKVRPLTHNHQMYNWQRIPNYGDFNEALDCKFEEHCSKVQVQKVGCLDSFFYNLTQWRFAPGSEVNHWVTLDVGKLDEYD